MDALPHQTRSMISLKDSQTRLLSEISQSGLTRKEWYRTIYLKSGHWKELRQRAFEAHGRICAGCQKTDGALDVHHLRYGFIFDVEPRDLQVLCRSCHDKEHVPKKVCTKKAPKPKKHARKKSKKKEKCTPMTRKQWKNAHHKKTAQKNKKSGKRIVIPDFTPRISWKRKGAGFV